MDNKFPEPESLIKAIIYVNSALFAAALFFSGNEVDFSINPLRALSPSYKTLIFFGATGTLPIDHYNQWWSLITASWLHGSLLHIIFNMIALTQTGYLVINIYGTHRMFIIYTLSGIVGFYLSYLAGVDLTIGASASICGLIGAALYYGKARGGMLGKAVFKQTSGWVISLAIFGFAIPGINNWGHGGGIVGGIFLGWMLGYQEINKEGLFHAIVSFSCMIITALILSWTLISAVYLKF